MSSAHDTQCGTIRKMLSDRGYTVDQDTLTGYNKDNVPEIIVSFHDKLTTEAVATLQERMKEMGVKRCIAVISEKPKTYAQNAISNLVFQGYRIETFLNKELMYNVTENILVPRHTVCSIKEKEDLLSAYSLTASKLPQIKSTDPIVRYLGLSSSKGTLLRIERKSETHRNKNMISYRIVV